jgi:NADPH:quinone reductase-like Zn-dependent oxidoreductase
MRAVVQRGYGGPDTWRLEDVPVPTPRRGEVLVRVDAAAIDRGTWHLMTGEPLLMRPAFGLRGPRVRVPGRDLAGTVAAVGSGVDALAVGDRVFGTASGSLAEYACADVRRLAQAPRDLGVCAAASVPISGQTALAAVCDAGRAQAGHRVLVLGASGGVGTFVVQIAVAVGAEVTAVCSGSKAPAVRLLGADHVIDRTADGWVEALLAGDGGFDLIVDIAGRLPVRSLRRRLEPGGALVLVGGESGGRWTSGYGRSVRAALRAPFVRRHRMVMLTAGERTRDLDRLRDLLETGAVVPAVDTVHPLDRAGEAMRRLVAGDVVGKLVIQVA